MSGRRGIVILCAITAVGAALRLAGVGQGLFGDELLTYDIVRRSSVDDVIRALLNAPESTPPLHYLLAWLSGKLSSAVSDVRLPSLLAGVAAIPTVWALGRRIAGDTAGLLAAAFLALDPFAIFYGTETRAYAMVICLSPLALLALLRAVERPTFWRWAALWATLVVAAYTHYILGPALAVMLAWAFWRAPQARRSLLVATGAAVVAYLPWVPHLRGKNLEAIEIFNPLTLGNVLKAIVGVLVAPPFRSLSQSPGRPALLLIGLGVALAGAGALLFRSQRHRLLEKPEFLLVVGLALVTPAVLLLYKPLTGTSIFAPRNLSPSIPFAMVAIAALVAQARRRMAAAAAACLATGFVIAAVRAMEPENARPATPKAAAVLRREARDGDLVAFSPAIPAPKTPALRRDLLIYLPHRLRHVESSLTPQSGLVGSFRLDPSVWRTERRVWVAGPLFLAAQEPRPPAHSGWSVAARHLWRGVVPYELTLYVRRGPRSAATATRTG